MITALLKIVPAFDARVMRDPSLGRARMVDRGAIRTLKPGETIPVLVNHDPDRVVGRVLELFVADAPDGTIIRPWWHAHVELDDPAPEWLGRSSGVSWTYNILAEQDIGDTQRILDAVIHEVSVLSPYVNPAENLARVVSVTDSPGPQVMRRDFGRVLAVR